MTHRQPGSAAALAAPIAIYVILYSTWYTAHLFLPDDAYYYFEIARNIAAGKGSTFDGINPTNGYHPLWCGVLALLGLLPLSKEGFVAAALTLQASLLAWTVVALFRACVRRESRPSAAAVAVAAVWLGNFYVSKTLLNGMESALLAATSVLLIAVAAQKLSAPSPVSVRTGLGLGALFSVVLLSRLDSVLLLVALGLTWAVVRRARLREEWASLAAVCVVPLVTLALYMAVNDHLFGLPVPVSGYLKRVVTPAPRTLRAALAFVPFALVVVALHRAAAGRWLEARSARHISYSILTLNVLLVQADSMIVRGEIVPPIWYLSQHALWVLGTLWLTVERLPARRWLITAIVAVASVGAAASWVVRLQPSSYDIYMHRRDMSVWMSEALPPGSVVGGWDVGITGYHCDLPVVNLDGLVNSLEYATMLERGEGLQYLDRVGVTHLAQSYLVDFDHFRPRGYDAEELRHRAGQVIWSVESSMKPVGGLVHDYLRTGKKFPMEVRVYTRPSIPPPTPVAGRETGP